VLKDNGTSYKRFVHVFFTGLVAHLTEVDPDRRASEVPGVDGHESTHELVRVHGSQDIALHVLAQLFSTCLGKRNGLCAVLVDASQCRLGRSRVKLLVGHGEMGWRRKEGTVSLTDI